MHYIVAHIPQPPSSFHTWWWITPLTLIISLLILWGILTLIMKYAGNEPPVARKGKS